MSAETKKIAIVDYGMGNLYSVQQALLKVGAHAVVTSDPAVVAAADAVVLPGVGAFAQAMQNLKERGLDKAVIQAVKDRKSFFGICLGLQLLFESSEEHGAASGLGILKGKVLKFPNEVNGKKVHIPQIGWNKVHADGGTWSGTELKSVLPGSYLYFVHSYYVIPDDSSIVLSSTVYEGFQYCSAVKSERVFAVQFHPEKSGEIGLGIYRDWVSGI